MPPPYFLRVLTPRFIKSLDVEALRNPRGSLAIPGASCGQVGPPNAAQMVKHRITKSNRKLMRFEFEFPLRLGAFSCDESFTKYVKPWGEVVAGPSWS